MIDKTDIIFCETCDMARLSEEVNTAWGFDETPLHTACVTDSLCGDYGKIRPCEYCNEYYENEDLTTGTDLYHGFTLCISCSRTLCPPTRFDW